MLFNNKYYIEYLVCRSQTKSGEFSGLIKKEILNDYTITNESAEIFADLYEKHRQENITGIEILKVEPVLKTDHIEAAYV